MPSNDASAEVRLEVMRATVDTGRIPDAEEVARALDLPLATVIASFRRLHDSHVVVLEPGTSNRLRMANPFSAVPSPFRVSVGERSWWGNCVWDALGIIAMMGGNGLLATKCPDCDLPLGIGISERAIQHGSGIAFIGVPAVSWWENIIFT
jgi:alkylmercury lyase-like protein